MVEKTTIQNLRPICSLCNGSMGTTNMEEFMKKNGYGNKFIKKCKNCDRFNNNNKFVTCCGLCRRLHDGSHTNQCNSRQVEIKNNKIKCITNNKFDINKCSHMELKTIKGIGDKKAGNIIKNRPYNSFDQVEKLSCINKNNINEIMKCTYFK